MKPGNSWGWKYTPADAPSSSALGRASYSQRAASSTTSAGAGYLRGPAMGGAAAESCTGDFIRIGTRMGASLGNMPHAWWAQLVVELAIRNRSTIRDVYSPYGDSMLMVNRHGVRVMNEKATYNERGQVHFHWDAGRREYPNYLMFWLFDQALIDLTEASRFRFPIPAPGETLD